ncbi:cupin domain-containing protein [Pseudodesulfovibrio sp.]|uniref:cupin domain-containing protein n=1 Tax=Pseudodesulfovibrio sp. TaxID=2035812 RepID=UPI00262A882D|nr:cupin domain-containing protein [Pseudodesulfovibrio sp.]MDD3311307.1 cupin domain-containing protein [Pseudodesulfovibrio sp.]
MKITAREIIDILGLTPHPEEGGFFSETHRSAEILEANVLPLRYGSPRRHSTAIYYLLTPETYSHLHRLETDEVFHFYLGDPCEMLRLHPDGRGETVPLGQDLASGQRPQVVVPRGVWQGMRLVPGGTFALMGCTVAPGFEYEDYAHGSRAELLERYPDFAELIRLLTRG